MHPSRVLSFLGWASLLAVLFAVFSNSDDAGKLQVTIVTGGLNVLFGVTTFLRHGGSRATVLGVFNIASSVFVGGAGVYAALNPDNRVTPEFLGLAVFAGFLLQLLVTTMAGRKTTSEEIAYLSPRDSRWAIRWGLCALIALIVVDQLSLMAGLGGWVEGAAVAATVVLAIGVAFREDARLISFGTAVVGVAFVAYATVFHSGAGRLRIIALACALLLLFTFRFRHHAIKWVTVLAAPIALALLAQQRLSLQESIAIGASAGRNGLESMLVPIIVFGQLLQEQSEGYTLGWGSSLLTFPMSFFPDDWFAGGPIAFGYKMVEITAPERIGTGFSTAATVGAEAIYNFALPGLFFAAPFLALLFVLMDRGLVRAVARLGERRTAIVAAAFWVMFSGAVADLAWNGQHIFLARTVNRLPLLMWLALLAVIDGALSRKQQYQRLDSHGRAKASIGPIRAE